MSNASGSRHLFDRVGDAWCDFFHNKPMWPINGRYQCGTCLRYHPVRWAATSDPLASKQSEIGTLSPSALNTIAGNQAA